MDKLYKKIKKVVRWFLATWPRRILASLLIVIFVLTPLSFLLFNKKTQAAWFDDAWYYRKSIAVSNSSGGTLTDFQVKILDNKDLSADISAGKIQSDLDDLRFTDINGKILPYWIEDSTGSSVDVWTKVPTIPTSGATIYMYYGNAQAPAYSNGNNVFEFFDDFSNYSLGNLSAGGKWTWESSKVIPTIVSDSGATALRLTPQSTNEGPILSSAGTVGDTVMYAKIRDANNAHYHIGRHSGLSSPVGDTGQGFWIYSGSINLYRNDTGYGSWVDINSISRSVAISSYHTYKVKVGGSSWNLYEDNASSPTISGTEATYNSGYPALITYSGEDMYVDYFFTCKYTSAEPSAGTPATEEKGPAPVGYWKLDEGYGTTAHDETSNKNDGTINGATWKPESECASGKCLSFDGTNDYISIPISSSLKPRDNLTLQAWVYPNLPYNGDIVILGPSAYYLTIQSDYSIQVYWYGKSPEGYHSSGANAVIPNQWNLITAAWDNSTVKIYANGILKNTINTSGTGNEAQTQVWIGAENSGGTRQFRGKIDEPKIYPYARTAAQVKQDYNAGLAGIGAAEGASVAIGGKSDKWMSDGLVGHWKMDEASWNGTSGEVIDASGNGNNGTATNGAAIAAGKFGNGGTFDGNNDYVNAGHNASLDITNRITISAWVKSSSTDHKIAYKNYNYHLSIYNGKPEFEIWDGGVWQSNRNVSGGTVLTNGVWYHVVGTYDGEHIQSYVNGVLDRNFDYTGDIDSEASDNFTIGGPTWPFNGSIDDVRIYNRALSPQEVSDLYNWAPGPVGYWKMDEKVSGDAKTLNDSSGNGNSGTTVDGANNTGMDCTKPGKYGTACLFDGTDDYVTVSNASSLNVSNVTLSAWIKPTSLPGSTHQRLITKNSTSGYMLNIYDNYFETYIGGQNVSGSTLTAGQWAYLTVTMGDGRIKTYTNGVKINDVAYTGSINGGSGSLNLAADNGSSLFGGSMDNVRIYNYARTQKQILEDMNGGQEGTLEPVVYYKFDEGYGTTVHNEIPGGDSATLASGSNMPAWSNNGKFGKALSFDGTNDYADLGSEVTFSTDAWTASLWFKSNKMPTGTATTDIQNFVNTSQAHNIQYWSVRGQKLAIWDVSSGSWFSSNTTLSANTWYHAALVYDGSGNYSVYLNGQLDNSWPNLGTTDDTCVIRYFGTYGTTERFFDGLIDDLKIYNYALTDNEVKLDMNQSASTVLGSVSSLPKDLYGDWAYYQDPARADVLDANIHSVLLKSSSWCGDFPATINKTGKYQLSLEYSGSGTLYIDNDGINDNVWNASMTATSDWQTYTDTKDFTTTGSHLLYFRTSGSNINIRYVKIKDISTSASSSSREYCVPGDATSCAGPVGEWKMDEKVSGDAKTLYDISGNGNNGTTDDGANNTGMDCTKLGKYGTGCQLDGTDDYIQLSSNVTLQNTDWTVSAWSKTGDAEVSILANKSGGPAYNAFQMSNSKISYFHYNGSWTREYGTSNVADNRWHYLTWSNNGTAQTVDLYVDGKWEANVSSSIVGGAGLVDVIGRYWDSGNMFFNGYIDDLRIYNYKRTSAQIAWDYNKGKPIAEWRFDECQGGTMHDESGNGNNGTWYGTGGGSQTAVGTCTTSGTAWGNGATGKKNSSLNFDGTDDYVSVNTSSYRFQTGDFSASVWAKATVLDASYDGLITTDTDSDAAWKIYRDSGNQYFSARFGTTTANFSTIYIGDWHMYTIVKLGTTLSLYMDGKLISNNTCPSSHTVESNSIVFGSYRINDAPNGSHMFNGQIDDVKIFNYALTPAQVKDVYNNGAVNFGN